MVFDTKRQNCFPKSINQKSQHSTCLFHFFYNGKTARKNVNSNKMKLFTLIRWWCANYFTERSRIIIMWLFATGDLCTHTHTFHLQLRHNGVCVCKHMNQNGLAKHNTQNTKHTHLINRLDPCRWLRIDMTKQILLWLQWIKQKHKIQLSFAIYIDHWSIDTRSYIVVVVVVFD